MYKLTDSTKKWLADEARSFFTTVFAFFLIDGAAALTSVYNGDFSRMVLWQLLIAIFRSCVKAILSMAMPSLFPPRKSDTTSSV